MTKQEEIEKGIAELTEDRFRSPAEGAGLNWDVSFNRMLARDILRYLHSKGVRKADREEEKCYKHPDTINLDCFICGNIVGRSHSIVVEDLI